MNKDINIKVCGKWILAGEYAVLRYYPALVFPLFSHFIELRYQRKNTNDLKVIEDEGSLVISSKQHTLVSVFESVLDQALQNVLKSRHHLTGVIRLNSQISFSAGMGASAVICVLIGKLFYSLNWLKEESLFYFCHALENTLHRQSSGVDIAAVLTGKPILYQLINSNLKSKFWESPPSEKTLPSVKSKKEPENSSGESMGSFPQQQKRNLDQSDIYRSDLCFELVSSRPQKREPRQVIASPTKANTRTQPQSSIPADIIQSKALIKMFQPLWKPHIFLSQCRQSNSTKVNIEQVQLFWKKNPKQADSLNKQMAQAVLKAKGGLEEKEKKKGLALLRESFSLAEDCFVKWDLINDNMKEHIVSLKKQGALAVKPTGSGSGGCVLSLWPELPPVHLRSQMISAF